MKKLENKGGMKMLKYNEIMYIKTLLKKGMENWEHEYILNDIYRHAKYTIRKLTKQMANIDNSQAFEKYETVNR